MTKENKNETTATETTERTTVAGVGGALTESTYHADTHPANEAGEGARAPAEGEASTKDFGEQDPVAAEGAPIGTAGEQGAPNSEPAKEETPEEEKARELAKYTDAERALFEPPVFTEEIVKRVLAAAIGELKGMGAIKVSVICVQARNEEAGASFMQQEYSEEAKALGECEMIGDLNRLTHSALMKAAFGAARGE